ncbi:hypothetical protein BU25DRAFT_296318, partial [Macroventuria anomochaeta]
AYLSDEQVKEAVEIMERVVAVEDEVLAAHHPDRQSSQHVLAVAYPQDGQMQKAIKLLERVVEAQEMLEPENLLRLVSQHELAITYKADGQAKKAIELLEHVVAVKTDSLRDDHPSRLVS